MILPPVARRVSLLIDAKTLPGPEGDNINGPSLIRVPDWVPGRLGRYYLYFGHHAGHYIRLAYADSLTGPWHIHLGGVLPLENCRPSHGHLASPDVHVDHAARKIRMYFHSPCVGRRGQFTFLAESDDGLGFVSRGEVLGTFYFRVWQMRKAWYALGKSRLYRSETGLSDFSEGRQIYGPDNSGADGAIRHTAVLQYEGRVYVFFTRLGDQPERILCAPLDTSSADWRCWRLAAPREILRPECSYEGADLPLTPGREGAQHGPQNALRDPCIYIEGERTYLLYGVAGEQGIALAELDMVGLARGFENPVGEP